MGIDYEARAGIDDLSVGYSGANLLAAAHKALGLPVIDERRVPYGATEEEAAAWGTAITEIPRDELRAKLSPVPLTLFDGTLDEFTDWVAEWGEWLKASKGYTTPD